MSAAQSSPDARACWLCGRDLGRRVEWHHPVPKSRGGKVRVALHAICHRTLHVNFSNAELARIGADADVLRSKPELRPFLRWIARKPPDFHARTARRK